MEDLRTMVYGVTFEETTFDYFDKLFGQVGRNIGSGRYIMAWNFDNFLLRATPIKTDLITIRTFGVTPLKNVYYDVKTVQGWLFYLGIDVDEELPEYKESIDEISKNKTATRIRRHMPFLSRSCPRTKGERLSCI